MNVAYLKLETPNIDGDCTAKGHEKEIEITGWNHSFQQPASETRASAGGGTTGQAVHAPLSITKLADSTTAQLLKNHWNGKTFAKATLSCFRASGDNESAGVEFLKVFMEDVVISSYAIGFGREGLPEENLTLDYGTVQYTYVLQKADGTAGGNKPAKHDLIKRTVS